MTNFLSRSRTGFVWVRAARDVRLGWSTAQRYGRGNGSEAPAEGFVNSS